MTIITENPEGLDSGNDLDNIEVPDAEETPSAYLAFGSSPGTLEEPPAVGEIRTFIVKTRCTAEHGPIERKDGELRYTRTLSIISCWEQGKPKPPDPDEEQPALFGEDGEVSADDEDDNVNTGDAADAEEDAADGDYGRPAFSAGGE